MITNYQQLSDLKLIRYREPKPENRKRFIIYEDCRVTACLEDKILEITVPAGFDTDLASIPKLVPKWIISKVDAHLEAAIVHDWLYRTGRYSKEISDLIFLAGMEAAGVNKFTRTSMYKAVKWFGGSSYKGE